MHWEDIEGNEDVNKLLKLFNYFHDSCLKELYMWSDHYVDNDLSMNTSAELDHKVRVIFQRQDKNPSAIEVFFENVTELHIIPTSENYDSIIHEATFLFEDGTFYWADVFGWKPEDKLTKEASWLSSKKVKWRDVSGWMGNKLRYGTE
ncbi:hypothetical protein ACOBQJ_00975 [Pelotomaculum propionicicum]|uniref:hypothetical protein n=1 Tax=Pelotomaculum propionicicum TaxID=258475 RepID=UPI003B81EE1A